MLVVYIPAGVSCRPIVSSLQYSVGADAQIHRATSALLPSALILCPSPGVKGETPNNAHPTFQLFTMYPQYNHTHQPNGLNSFYLTLSPDTPQLLTIITLTPSPSSHPHTVPSAQTSASCAPPWSASHGNVPDVSVHRSPGDCG